MELEAAIAERSQAGRIRKDADGRLVYVDENIPSSNPGTLEFDGIVLTKSTDRDGDVLDPMGANVDPNAPLLWQHDPEKPVGKMLSHSKSTDKLSGRFVLADTELGRDVAKLLEIKALRFSHGFRPIDVEPLRDSKGVLTGGFHVKRFEIIEVSLVSIPANPEALVQDIRRRSLSFESAQVKSWATELVKKSSTVKGQNMEPNQVIEKNGNGRMETKPASSRYSSKRWTGKHPSLGEIRFKGRTVETPSELDRAKVGVFMRAMAIKSGQAIRPLDDHEKALFEELFEEAWIGVPGGSNEPRRYEGSQVKALLNDGTSGGQELVPEFFDDQLVTFPLLFGELLPLVTMRDVPRSDSVEGASIDNPTVTWNNAEGTDAGLFNTASLVQEINTSIFPVDCFVEVGRDFLSDAAANVGDTLVNNIGARMGEELDKVIANGNGTTQAQGIFVASGTTTVSSISGTSGPLTIGDAENLLFGLAKQYRTPARRPVFLGNDASYRRFRSVRVGASDARRVFGMDHQSYMLLEYPFKVQNDIADNAIGFAAMERYRLYRRQGQSVRWEMGGKELARKNLALLIVRGRYGGRLVDGAAAAVMNDAAIVGPETD